MKVKQFLKRRIFPVMLSLVIVFFSVVIPCARVEASSLVVPAPVAGFSYYDLVSSAFLSTGFDCPLQKSDGTRTTFGKEMYDELCDTFDLWCNDNFGTTDASEIKEQLRALPGNIVNGTVTVTKALWDALKEFGSNAYDYVSTHFMGDESQYMVDGYRTWDFIKATGCPMPSGVDLSSPALHSWNPYYILCSYSYGSETYYSYCEVPFSQYFHFYYYSYGGYYDFSVRGSDSVNWQTTRWTCKKWQEGQSAITDRFFDWPADDNTIHIIATNMINVPDIDAVNWKEVADANADVKWPVQDLAIDKVVSGPTTWEDAIAKDIIVPGEAADTAVIGLTHTDEDSDVIPGTATGDVTDDPAVSDDAKPDVNEIVSSEEISSFPEKVKKAVGDVTNLFPFCIPFDIVRLIRGMEAEQKPPIWHFEYYFEEIDYTFVVDIDMTDYEKYIKIFRAGIVIFWIIALMLITIRFSSGIVKD